MAEEMLEDSTTTGSFLISIILGILGRYSSMMPKLLCIAAHVSSGQNGREVECQSTKVSIHSHQGAKLECLHFEPQQISRMTLMSVFG